MLEEELCSALLADRAVYDALAGSLDPREFGERAGLVIRVASDYYAADSSAERVSRDVLDAALTREVANPKHLDGLRRWVAELPPCPSPANLTAAYRQLRRHNVGLKLAAHLASGQAGAAEALVTEWIELGTPHDARRAGRLGLADLVQATRRENLVWLGPKALNEAAGGGASPGHHIILFGRPEAGKSGFAINQTAVSLRQGKRVLYVGNEEPLVNTQVRLLARLTGVPLPKLKEDPEALAGAYRRAEAVWDRAFFLEALSGRMAEIEAEVRRVKPDVMIVDQMRNISMPGNQGRVLELDHVARQIRRLTTAHGLVTLSITQAGDSGDQKQVLAMGDIDWSNTGIQAACDMMVGLGVTDELERQGKRWISLPKNKIGGEHRNFPVWFDWGTSLYSSEAPRREYPQ